MGFTWRKKQEKKKRTKQILEIAFRNCNLKTEFGDVNCIHATLG